MADVLRHVKQIKLDAEALIAGENVTEADRDRVLRRIHSHADSAEQDVLEAARHARILASGLEQR